MNLLIRILWIVLTPFGLYFSACAGDNNENNSDSIEKVIIKESIINTIDAGNGMTFSYADVLEKATPSVVSVYTSKYASVYSNRMPNGIPDLFRQFGIPVPEMYNEPEIKEEEKEELKPYGAGSGVIMTENGYIITNHHVVHDQRGKPVDEIRIRLNDKREYVAELIGSDQKTDIAVLKIEVTSAITPLNVANSDQIRMGDVVFAIGNPLEVGITATQGIVSATGRHSLGILGQDAYEDFIQTDASINLGNSGGALIDAYGRLIGINTAIFSRSGGSIGIGFAIPVNIALDVMKKLVEVGEVPRGLLGIYSQNVTLDIAEAFGLESTEGALVDQVQKDSPADLAGISHGDIIIKIDDQSIESSQDLRLKVSQMNPGAEVLVFLYRDGNLLEIPVVLGDIEDGFSEHSEGVILEGLTLKYLDQEIRAKLSIPEKISGVLVADVSPKSPFARSIRPNTIIMEVNGKSVTEPKDIGDYIDEEKANRFYVWYNGRISYLVLRF
ncbi:MAG: Do family serine endopeptidase [Opitutae bacterium]|nr:Do family serine endopeptidase [Opitutae bacterium]